MAKKSKMTRVSAEEENQRAALYIRVSTDRQAEEGYSIEVQKERLNAYVASIFGKNAVEKKLYIDDGYSGGTLDRPEMRRLIEDAINGEITVVLVYKLDRLSRSQKDTLYLIEDVFLPHNVSFVSIQESFNTATAFGRAVVGILSVFAQLERENIFERTRSGMQKRVEAGLWPGGGRVPFGYDYDRTRGILVPNRDAERVRQIYDLYIKGYAFQTIANLLNLKYDKLAYQILTRKSNAGYITYNDVEYKGLHEPIVPLETYEKAMSLLQERSEKRFVSKSDYLLTGLVYCGKCGAKMRYQKWGKGGCKLVCYSQQKSKPYLVKDPNCDNERVWADEIEDAVIKDLLEMTKKDFEEKEAGGKSLNALEILQNQRSLASRKLKRLYSLYGEGDDEMLLEAISDAKAELDRIVQRIAEEEEHGAWTQSINRKKEELKSIADIWPHLSIQEKRSALRSVIDRITVTGDAVCVDYKF